MKPDVLNVDMLLEEKQPLFEYRQVVDDLRKARRYDDIERLFLGLLDLAEAQAVEDTLGVSPWPYSELSRIYRYKHDTCSEQSVLERFSRQKHAPGVTPQNLLARLSALRSEPLSTGLPFHYSQNPRMEPWAPMFGKTTRPTVLSQHINNWWSSVHDTMIREEVKRTRWYWDISYNVLQTLTESQLERWRQEDPALTELSETQLIRDFAQNRSREIKVRVPVPSVEPKICECCNESFLESSIHPRWLHVDGYETIPYCRVCIDCVHKGRTHCTRSEVVGYIKDAFAEFSCVPTTNWHQILYAQTSLQERARVFQILAQRPNRDAVRNTFGTWFEAFIAAGIVDKDGERGYFGTRSVSSDGHVCLSMGERTICEMLTNAGIEHGHEPMYPHSRMRADFLIGHTLVEYLGLYGNPDYDAKTKRKRAHAKEYNLQIEFIYPADLAEQGRLLKRLKAHIPKESDD